VEVAAPEDRRVQRYHAPVFDNARHLCLPPQIEGKHAGSDPHILLPRHPAAQLADRLAEAIEELLDDMAEYRGREVFYNIK